MKNILTQILGYTDVNYTKAYANDLYEQQPFKDSMFGLSILLSKYHIENRCIKLADKTAVKDVTYPFVVILQGSFFICTSINNNTVSLVAASGKKSTITYDEFIGRWNGILLTARKTPDSIEPDYIKHKKEQRLSCAKYVLIAVSAAIMIVAGIRWNNLNHEWWLYAAMAVDIAGIGVGYMLLQKELHIKNGFAERLCSLIKESRCEDVTESAAASFFGLAKLSEIGAGFFTVNLLVLLFVPEAAAVLAVMALAVLPFSFWSVWYQKFRAHSWCVLCLSTLALMWLQAGVLWAGGAFGDYNGIENLLAGFIVLIAAYGLTVLSIGRVVDVIRRSRERDMWRLQYNSLKADDKVMEAFEKDVPQFEIGSTDCSGLIFGNPESERRITVFSNPYCGPCAMMHERVKDMPSETCCVQYVLAYFSEDLSDINRYFIAAYHQLGAKRAWEVMTDWYAGGKSLGKDFFKDFQGLRSEPNSLLKIS